MLLYGDEVGRSQRGNNNGYCHETLGDMDWDLLGGDESPLVFFQRLIEFRRAHNCLRRGSFVPMAGNPLIRMDWHGTKLGQPDWSPESHSLLLHICELEPAGIKDSVCLITNAHWLASEFELPKVEGHSWRRFIDTSLQTPDDIAEPGQELEIKEQSRYRAAPRSTVVLVGRP